MGRRDRHREEDVDDVNSASWIERALCRWCAYLSLWLLTCAICLLSDLHQVLKVLGIILSVLLAISLPLFSATLFEEAYLRRARRDLPVLICPWLGVLIVLLGSLALVSSSSLVLWTFSNAHVASAEELCSSFAGVPLDELPRTACMEKAFVKTGWEAGKLACENLNGRVSCVPSFVAAPIYNSAEEAAAGLPNNIWAWAVMHGRHVNANYELDGSLCGYLASHAKTEFYLGSFRWAVNKVLEKHKLALTGSDKGACSAIPLGQRPLLLTSDLMSATERTQAWCLIGGILLCFCPCVGPLPLLATLLFLSRVRSNEREVHA